MASKTPAYAAVSTDSEDVEPRQEVPRRRLAKAAALAVALGCVAGLAALALHSHGQTLRGASSNGVMQLAEAKVTDSAINKTMKAALEGVKKKPALNHTKTVEFNETNIKPPNATDKIATQVKAFYEKVKGSVEDLVKKYDLNATALKKAAPKNATAFANGLLAGLFDKAEATKENVARRLLDLPAISALHLCVTGSQAKQVVEHDILPSGYRMQQFEMPSKVAPDNHCTAWELALGQSLITAVPNIEDRCAGRFKVHSLSCDIMVHAESGNDCSQLRKLRFIAQEKHVPLLTVAQDAGLLKCYEEERAKDGRGLLPRVPPEVHQLTLGDGESLRSTLLGTMSAVKVPPRAGEASPDAEHVRERMMERAGPTQDHMVELLRRQQGPAATRSLGANEEMGAYILDVGSDMVRAGFAGNDGPTSVFPAIVGRPLHPGVMVGMEQKDAYVGDEAQAKRGILRLTYPVVKGVITDFDDWTKIIHHTFYNELRVTPEEHAVLIAQDPLQTKENRAKVSKIMFENFKVPRFYTADRGLLALYASGRLTGIVLMIASTTVVAVPISEGYVLQHAVMKIDVGGKTVTAKLHSLLEERGYSFRTTAEKAIVSDIKEKLSYVAEDYDKEMKQDVREVKTNYEMPDGNVITMDKERFQCSEVLFKTTSNAITGIHNLLVASIKKVDADLHGQLYKNIVLSGSGTMQRGLTERLQNEVKKLAGSFEIRVVTAPERKYSTWIGGSLFASLSQFEGMWVTKDEYAAEGASIVERKCM